VTAPGPPAEEAARAERVFQEQVHRDLPRNYLAHLAHGLLGQTGFRLLNAPTFVPAYVHLLSGSDVAVGLARALQSFGMFLSPILGATAIEHRRRVLPVGFVVGGLMRLQVIGIALAAFFLPPRIALFAVLLLLGLFGFFLGMQGVVFNFLLSKVIPIEGRGRLLGLRNALAGLTAGGVAVLGGHWVESSALGNGYAATFLAAFVLTSAGLACLGFVREPASPRVREPVRVRERLRDLPALLRGDPAFTRYFLARALGTMGRMSVPFYVVYAGTKMAIGGRRLGVLTLAFVVAQSCVNLLWGWLADRRGFRLVFLLAQGVWIGSALLLLATAHYGLLIVVMVGLGAGVGGFMMAAQNLVLEFGSRHNLPLRIAVANSSSELVGAIGPLVAGVLGATVSYRSIFWTGIVFQTAALALMALWVEEPRHRTA
jgi:MFS family permease